VGPGGVPEGVSLVAELASRWQPPPPLTQAPQPGSTAPPVMLGQVSGDYMPCRHARPEVASPWNPALAAMPRVPHAGCLW
jgi:hypothetical protein